VRGRREKGEKWGRKTGVGRRGRLSLMSAEIAKRRKRKGEGGGNFFWDALGERGNERGKRTSAAAIGNE
jgi:hypothetical protein